MAGKRKPSSRFLRNPFKEGKKSLVWLRKGCFISIRLWKVVLVFNPSEALDAEFLGPFNFPSVVFVCFYRETRTGRVPGALLAWVRLLINLRAGKLAALPVQTVCSPGACPGPWPSSFHSEGQG